MITGPGAALRVAAAALLGLAGVLAAAPAVATTTPPTVTTSPPPPTPTTGPTTELKPVTAADRDWLTAAHQAHLSEIASGQDVQRHGAHAEVRSLAGHLVADHTRLDRDVVLLARKYGVALPGGMTDAQRGDLYRLQGTDDQAYDPTWLRQQIRAHRAQRAAAATELRIGTAYDVVDNARAAQPVIEAHLDALESLSRRLGLTAPATVTGGTGGQMAAAASHAGPAALLGLTGVALIAVEIVRRRRTA